MSAEKRWRLVCYDVRDPKRYRELYKIIRGVGQRIQYSVFRCRLDDREVERLRWKLAKVLDVADQLLVVDLCPSCASRVISRNHVEGWTDKPASFTIVAAQASPDAVSTEKKDAEKTSDSVTIPSERSQEGS